ncbi:MAG TPA: hypothetical protein VGI69_09970 [Gaiellaceae bacterium]|jgi:hypothetical protein
MSAWLPVVTLVGGYGLSQLADLRRERRDDRLRLVERQQQLDDERRHREADLQHEALRELQEAGHALLQASTADVLDRADDAKERGVPFLQAQGSDRASEEIRAGLGRLFILEARVQDETTRKLTNSLEAACGGPAFLACDTVQAALRLLNDGWQIFGTLNERVGVLLRERY